MLSEILRTTQGWFDAKEAALLHELAQNATDTIVEIGSYRGRSTAVLASGAQEGVILYSVDPHMPADDMPYNAHDHAALLENLTRLQLGHKCYIVNLPSPDVAKIWKLPVGLCFIDGAHQQVDTDFRAWEKHIVKGGLCALHDVNLDSVQAVIATALKSGKWTESARADNTAVLQKV